ncbi:hypothetical protein BS78_10G050100 [Paspalum vaginatum]|nr:hypothetical protein BS78_10G050100 [Paspalum vaginatum]
MATMAAASSEICRPRSRTASMSGLETARGTHVFKIARYSLHKGIGVTNFFRSATFGVGGYDWCIRFYPDGFDRTEDHTDYVAVFLELISVTTSKVRASFDIMLVDQATGQPTTLVHQVTPNEFAFAGKNAAWGTAAFMERSELESPSSPFLRDDDCLVVECDVAVVIDRPPVETAVSPSCFEVQVPPSNLSDHLRKLLEEKRGADVSFKVEDDGGGEEVFLAHGAVLAARSPVFNAELFGPMAMSAQQQQQQSTAGQRQCTIAIQDMQADVFRALLHFVYTDTMPDMEGLDADDRVEMAKHLLVAADRYAVERLKLMCEAVLCRSLGVENVAAMLALADRHHCSTLRDACAEFIASSDKIGSVVSSQGYLHLKKACPAVLVDMLERVAKCMQRWMRP